ncbi:hypothetical protein NHX12_007659 [Muraenolepis orangiensis]|uniref:Uncharacterized protein n=1 Tax=Muraenolepis orangiensis TaxID=630683 RepID=A0A9Q0DTW3_9TELE|nr:hypothetical protein NHX12_007659 [Muraenolepis orangiensis]
MLYDIRFYDIMVYDILLYDIILYDIMLYDIMLDDMLGDIMLDDMLGDIMLGDIMLYDIMLYDIIIYDIMLYDSMLYDIMLYDIMLTDSGAPAIKPAQHALPHFFLLFTCRPEAHALQKRKKEKEKSQKDSILQLSSSPSSPVCLLKARPVPLWNLNSQLRYSTSLGFQKNWEGRQAAISRPPSRKYLRDY